MIIRRIAKKRVKQQIVNYKYYSFEVRISRLTFHVFGIPWFPIYKFARSLKNCLKMFSTQVANYKHLFLRLGSRI